MHVLEDFKKSLLLCLVMRVDIFTFVLEVAWWFCRCGSKHISVVGNAQLLSMLFFSKTCVVL